MVSNKPGLVSVVAGHATAYRASLKARVAQLDRRPCFGSSQRVIFTSAAPKFRPWVVLLFGCVSSAAAHPRMAGCHPTPLFSVPFFGRRALRNRAACKRSRTWQCATDGIALASDQTHVRSIGMFMLPLDAGRRPQVSLRRLRSRHGARPSSRVALHSIPSTEARSSPGATELSRAQRRCPRAFAIETRGHFVWRRRYVR